MSRVTDLGRVAVLLCLGGSLLVSASCTKHEDCSCFNPGVVVSAPKGELVSIALSGPACEHGKIICTDRAHAENEFVPGCEQYSVLPAAAGECRLHIETKKAGPVDEIRMVEDRRNEACCGGFYTSPSSSGTIVVGN